MFISIFNSLLIRKDFLSYNLFFNLIEHSLHNIVELFPSHVIFNISESSLEPFPHSAQVPNLSAPLKSDNFVIFT